MKTSTLLVMLPVSTTAAPLATRLAGLTCNDACTGVSSALMQQAAGSFCQLVEEVPITKGANPDIYMWQPTTDAGFIEMTWGILNKNECPSALTVNSTTCLDNMNVPISLCNSDSSDNKQGGTWETPCLTFSINPNPQGC